jgi:uncharacterized protein YccT (UPF0319 family)
MENLTRLEQKRKWIKKYRTTEEGKAKIAESNLKYWFRKAQELLQKFEELGIEKSG